ncbi:hypothetical protein CH375_19250 [Leptospira ellisii]|uniref:Uncharacterized protein n=1 Tax=Leptospira ellisii TaxID=2023197 RepID=A0A2N0BGD1_9LEPT|nr:hypothetical protein CH379_05495 [Leptospira ellisii]PKA03056.1 hypothetical protein CH375_19250 [Leptospira ellisii]
MKRKTRNKEKTKTRKRSRGTMEKRILKKEVITEIVSRNDWMDWDRPSKLVFKSVKKPVN